MGMADRHTIYEHDAGEWQDDGSGGRHQSIRVHEWWQTIGANGKPYTSRATREDAIYEHLHSNAFMSDQREQILKEFGRTTEVHGEPLCGVRHVVRYETTSAWEETGDIETIDVLAEIANEQPCQHPPERAMTAPGGYGKKDYRFCGRCHERLSDAGEPS